MPHYKAVPSHERVTHNHDFFALGLEPRKGFAPVELGRPITGEEFEELTARLGLTEDDISDEFEDTVGKLYGGKNGKSFVVRQVKTKVPGDAIGIETELREKKAYRLFPPTPAG